MDDEGLDNPPREPLTEAEEQVMEILLNGNVEEMAATLDLTPDEVRNRVQSIMTKLQVHSRLEAVQAWRRLRP